MDFVAILEQLRRIRTACTTSLALAGHVHRSLEHLGCICTLYCTNTSAFRARSACIRREEGHRTSRPRQTRGQFAPLGFALTVGRRKGFACSSRENNDRGQPLVLLTKEGLWRRWPRPLYAQRPPMSDEAAPQTIIRRMVVEREKELKRRGWKGVVLASPI